VHYPRFLQFAAVASLAALLAAQAPQSPVAGQIPGQSSQLPPRAIRRDVPLTDSIQRAYAAGTRDRTGAPTAKYWQLEADYAIDVRLDELTGTLHGKQTITVRNGSPDALDRLVLRLDHNLFRPEAARDGSTPAETTDGMVVTALAVDGVAASLGPGGGSNPAAAKAPRATGLTQTVASVRLVKPIPAGGSANVDIEWHTKLPGGDGGRGHRMTQRWDLRVFQPTQWYPRLAKYDDLRGWVTSPYLGPSEFYNNFGRFDVRIDVPGGWLVSGTGLLKNAEAVLSPKVRERLAVVTKADDEVTVVDVDERGAGKATAVGDRLVWNFVAERVNDFAWATSLDYVWHATRATIPAGGVAQGGPVPIHMLFVPERARLFRRAGDTARHALEFYSELIAPYPFPQLTMQDGPSDGMEYPMVVNSNQGAADHEIAHQWWPMMVGNDETRYGWMDEGFNMYMNLWSDAHRRGRQANLDGRGQLYGRVCGDEDEPPMMWNANQAGSMYGFVTYEKTPMMLSMLGGLVGDDKVVAALRVYAREWAFKHPSPWDFAFLMQRELGVELGWFWNSWLFRCQSVDGRIARVRDLDGGMEVVVAQDGEMPSPIVLRVDFDPAGAEPNLPSGAIALDGAAAEITVPVEVWFDGRREHTVTLPFGKAKVTKVTLDPGGRFPDKERGDNAWVR
jgi:hypothetical protein